MVTGHFNSKEIYIYFFLLFEPPRKTTSVFSRYLQRPILLDFVKLCEIILDDIIPHFVSEYNIP